MKVCKSKHMILENGFKVQLQIDDEHGFIIFWMGEKKRVEMCLRFLVKNIFLLFKLVVIIFEENFICGLLILVQLFGQYVKYLELDTM